MGYISFEDLKVWQLASKLSSKITELVKTFPKHEKYDLVNQCVVQYEVYLLIYLRALAVFILMISSPSMNVHEHR